MPRDDINMNFRVFGDHLYVLAGCDGGETYGIKLGIQQLRDQEEKGKDIRLPLSHGPMEPTREPSHGVRSSDIC